MNAVTHYMTIDLLRETVDGTVFIRNASIGHRLSVRLTAGSRVLTLPEATEGIVQLVYKLPDGTKSDVQMTADYGDAWVMIPRAMLSMTGVVDCEVRVYLEELGTWTTSPQFTVTVQDVIYDEDAQEEIVSDPTVYESIVSSEAERRENEETRKDNEEERQDNEEERQDNEEERQANEEIRKANEEARIAGGAITLADVDSALSGTSVNPVQNRAIKDALDGKQDTLTFDTEPILGSPRPVKSGGIYTAIQNLSPSVITGTFTLRFTEQSGSYIFVKQIGNVVYIYGMIQSTGTLADASAHHLGDITGVDGPARAISLPVWTTSDAVTWTPGIISLAEISGSIYVGMGVKETDSAMLINAFYTV